MDEDLPEQTLFAKFEKKDQFLTLLHTILSLDLEAEPIGDGNRSEISLLRQLSEIIDEYQEQSYLLDPFLEQLVVPAVEKLKTHTKSLVAKPSTPVSHARLDRVAQLLYGYIKFRGYKTIIRFFPHEIADLSIVLDYLLLPTGPAQEQTQWALRYIVLLWLSLICMIPFDLVQFDEDDSVGKTADTIESVAKAYLGRAGLERESAALTLSRLYSRKDTSYRFPVFLRWSLETFETFPDLFLAVGILQTLSEITKSGPPELIQEHLSLTLDVARSIDRIEQLSNNTVIRKLRTKIVARAALRLLPAKSNLRRRRGHVLLPEDDGTVEDPDFEAEIEVPEDVETSLEDLFRAIQDKDTVVRWSAAKGVARISDRLPSDFAEQVLETVMGQFSTHSIGVASIYDMPSIAEGTWHGACLSCAELARRGLVSDEQLPALVEWLCKALYFDIRKGSHSIGSSVRDAAAYVLWSLARAQDSSSLAPHATDLARRLAAVSLFDREVHIRRAASAAYQEYVGRTSLFPDGIDVLRKTDFYAVGVRRNSFLIAAAQVAEHEQYRAFLIDHLLDITLRHWDSVMRHLGAQSLQSIVQLDLPILGPQVAQKAAILLKMHDWNDIHGGMTALTELANAFSHSGELEKERRTIFKHLLGVPLDIILAPRNDLVLSAACHLIASSISLEDLQSDAHSTSRWRQIVDFGLRHRTAAVQDAAASALQAVSRLIYSKLTCIGLVITMIKEFRLGLPSMQQSLGRLLGVLDYASHPHGTQNAVRYLLESVQASSPLFIHNVEARRNCYEAMPLILANLSSQLPEQMGPATVCQLIDALLEGLTDYTMDERGDVGSWIRMASIKGLASFAEILFSCPNILDDLESYFPPEKYQNAISGILKQGVERLDNVRSQAGQHFMKVFSLPLPDIEGREKWKVCGDELISRLFLSDQTRMEWNEAGWLYPKAVQLLEVPEYRDSVLTGLVLSVGSKTDSTHRPVSSSLVEFVRRLPTSGTPYDLRGLVKDLVEKLKKNISKNTLALPLFQTFNILLEADALEKLIEDELGTKTLKVLLDLATRSISRIKNVQRIQASMKIAVNLLNFPKLYGACLAKLGEFLQHQYPTIRAGTAETLYLVLQSRDLGRDTDEAEDVLLQTEWSSNTGIPEASIRLVNLLQ